jgi:4-hydroxy-tetrahydrodipicolinate reductase
MPKSPDIHVLVFGALGRMGSQVVQLVHEEPGLALTGAIERPDHPDLGRDVGEVLRLGPMEIEVSSNPGNALSASDCVVDFTNPSTSLEALEASASAGIPFVTGTTGFSEEETARFRDASGRIPVVLSPNMSLGVTLLFKLVELSARALDGYDIEIVEAHHRHKKDSPSGTAKRLVEVLKAARKDLKEIHGREGFHGERGDDELGILSIRAGDIPGDHTVLFASKGERLELTHRAVSRLTFARGTLRAVRFAVAQKPGLYSMSDVLGL